VGGVKVKGEEHMTDKEALKMALETAEQIACADYRHWEELASLSEFERWARSRANHIADALRTALAETDVPETAFGETEPVAWMHNFIDDVITKNRPTDITRNAGRWTALYTAPLAKEWAGLTDKEYEAMAEQYVTNCYFDTLKYAQAIETKLKEKN
jgi:hypothetical protein